MVLPYLGTDPAKRENDPYWATTCATERGDLEGLKSLIFQRRTESNHAKLLHDLQFALGKAVENCNLPIVEYLLSEGAIIDPYVLGRTARGKNADATPVFALFKKHGWDVNAAGPDRGPKKGSPIFL